MRAYTRDDIAKIRSESADVLKKQADLYWKGWVFGQEPDLATAYQGHESLFTPETVKTLADAQAASKDGDARALDFLEGYVAGEVIARDTAPLEDKIESLENAATVKVGDVDHGWRDLDELIAGEPNAEARARLYAAELPLVEKIAPLVAEVDKRTDASAKALGWASALAFAMDLHHADPAGLQALANATLEATEAPYKRAMDRLATEELALPLAKMHRSDLARLMRLGRSDGAFPATQLIPTALGVFGGLGIEVSGQKGLTLHTANLPQKNPQPVAFPVSVPDDVRVSVKPTAGPEFLRDLLHELAHAEFYLHDTRPEWEFQVLDGGAVMEGYAALFSGLLDDPAFLKAKTNMKDGELSAFVRRATARRLLAIRHAAARVLFELSMRANPAGNQAETYRQLLSRAYGFELSADDAKHWPLDRPDFFAAADELRGALLAAQLERALVAKFGAAWWTSKDAGALVTSWWARGTEPTPTELAATIGAPDVSPQALAQTMTERLDAAK